MNRREKRQAITWTLITALMVNMLFPLFAANSLPSLESSPNQLSSLSANTSLSQKSSNLALSSEKILICTANGFKWVSLAELQENPPPEYSSHENCPLCSTNLVDHQQFSPSADCYVTQAEYLSSNEYPEIEQEARTQIFARGILARAPPQFS